MYIRLTTVIFLAATVLSSCSKTEILSSTIIVADHISCNEDDPVVVDINIIGGEGPYIIQVYSILDNEMIYVVNSDRQENEVMIQEKGLVDYKVMIKSADFQEYEAIFQIFPEGKSSLGHRVLIEGKHGMRPVTDMPVSLYLTQSGGALLVETILTDHNGQFSFSDLASGTYSLEVILENKYDEYKLEAFDQNGRSLVDRGSSMTNLIPIACDEVMQLELMFKK